MTGDTEHPVAQACLFGSVAMLGQALQIHDGFYDETALAWLTAALLCVRWLSSHWGGR